MKYLYHKENTIKTINNTNYNYDKDLVLGLNLKPKIVSLMNDARHYPPSNKEWMNSVYSYNNNSIKSLPVKDKLLYNLLKSYFNLKKNKFKGVASSSALTAQNLTFSSLAKKNFKDKNLSLLILKAKENKKLTLLKEWKKSLILANKEQENRNDSPSNYLSLDKDNKYSTKYLLLRKQRLLKKLRAQEKKKNLFLKKTFISLPEIKHSNNKSIITVSIYNRNNFILQKKIYKLYKMFIYKKKKSLNLLNNIKYNALHTSDNNTYQNLIALLDMSPEKTKYLERNKYYVVNLLKFALYKKIYSFFKKRSNLALYNQTSQEYVKNGLLFGALLYDVKKINLRKLKKLKKIFKRKYKKLLKYKYYVMLLCFYKFRLNNSNLLGLKNIIRKMYGKKIVFRIINLKYMYLDSNIMAEAITKKLRDRKKRILRILKTIIKSIKKVSLVENLWNTDNFSSKLVNKGKIYNNTAVDLVTNDKVLVKPNNLKGVILYNLNHKIINGIKIQGSGRLTKRLTASRSITKFRSKGSLKNINSSFKGISTVMVRGYFKSNLQYVNINSYNRNGSFGVKSWISSY